MGYHLCEKCKRIIESSIDPKTGNIDSNAPCPTCIKIKQTFLDETAIRLFVQTQHNVLSALTIHKKLGQIDSVDFGVDDLKVIAESSYEAAEFLWQAREEMNHAS